jgi:hypothetical protein
MFQRIKVYKTKIPVLAKTLEPHESSLFFLRDPIGREPKEILGPLSPKEA